MNSIESSQTSHGALYRHVRIDPFFTNKNLHCTLYVFERDSTNSHNLHDDWKRKYVHCLIGMDDHSGFKEPLCFADECHVDYMLLHIYKTMSLQHAHLKGLTNLMFPCYEHLPTTRNYGCELNLYVSTHT